MKYGYFVPRKGHERIRSEDCPSEYWHECWKPKKDSRYTFRLDFRGHEALGNPLCQFVETTSVEHQPTTRNMHRKGRICARFSTAINRKPKPTNGVTYGAMNNSTSGPPIPNTADMYPSTVARMGHNQNHLMAFLQRPVILPLRGLSEIFFASTVGTTVLWKHVSRVMLGPAAGRCTES